MGTVAPLAWLAAALLSGCLVTSEIDFQTDPNSPPVVLDKPGNRDTTIGSILWVDKSTENSWELLVDVRDEDVSQEVSARWRVQTESDMTPEFEPATLPKTGVLRELQVRIDQGDIRDGECHRLQLVVSGSFFDRDVPALFDVTMDPDDIGRASWWLWEGRGEALTSDEQKLRLNDSCRTVELLGAQAAPP